MIGSGLESPLHLLVLFIIAFLLLGPKRLPQLARSLGSGIRELRDSISGVASGDPEPEEEPASAPLPGAVPEGAATAPFYAAGDPRAGALDGGQTREQLYQRARELSIEGRSKMNKAQLERAIEAAQSG